MYSPDHPYANKDGYVPEQRLLTEEDIGRYINPLVEDVHHKDGNVQNNSKKNRVLLTKKEHRRSHAGWRLIDGEWWKTCLGCGKFLKVEDNFYRRRNGHNEYVTRCKECIRQISADKRLPKLSHQERSLIAVEAAYKGWKTRKQNKIGGK